MRGNGFGWLTWLLLLGLARAHFAGVRLLILGLAGLAGLYLVHNLAQDFNKIQNSWNKGTGNVVNSQLTYLFGLSRNRRSAVEDHLTSKSFDNGSELLANIVKNDPIGCARKYVCYISSKPLKELTSPQRKILMFLRSLRPADSDGVLARAEDIGRLQGDPAGCRAEYPACLFSGHQLDAFLDMIS